MTDPATHSCSILNVTLAEDGITCPHGITIREGQEFQLGGQTVTLGPAEPVLDSVAPMGALFAERAHYWMRENDGARDAAPKRNVAVSVYKSLERYGCEGDRTETMRLADSLLEDFVIIPNYDMPEVVWREGMNRWETTPDERGIHAERGDDPDWFEARAQEYMAMAIHLRANPPVDEVQVQALAALMRDTENVRNDVEKQARRLIATGRVEVQP